MRTSRRVGVAAFVLFGFASGAGSEAVAQTTVIQEPDQVIYKPRTVIEFTPTEVRGSTVKPDGQVVVVPGQSHLLGSRSGRQNPQEEVLIPAGAQASVLDADLRALHRLE